MPRKKSYRTQPTVPEEAQCNTYAVVEGSVASSESWNIPLPSNPTMARRVALSQWIGRGIDDWVRVVVQSLQAMLGSGEFSPTTVCRCGDATKIFFEFLTNVPGQGPPSSLDRDLVVRYIKWLQLRYGEGTSTAKGRYSALKTVLLSAIDRGIISNEKLAGDSRTIFPANPFPGSNAKHRGSEPLSKSEVERLAAALRVDLIAIHQGRFDGTEGEAITVSFLLVALRTGTNLIPLLELTRDCLSENPFAPNMMVMQVFKRRGNATHLKALRFSDEKEVTRIIPMDGVAVLRKVMERNAPLVADADASIKNRVWIYRSASGRNNFGVTVLSSGALTKGVESLVKRHHLMADNEKPLAISTQRLRKTMESRLWQISGGDLISVASVMGHSPEVADQHYLRMTEDMKSEAAQFIGVTLPGILRGDGMSDEDIPFSQRKTLQNTPVGRCSNSLNGHFAPGDGINHCDQFSHCLGCPNLVIVGTVKDLYRLFSFQIFLRSDIEYMTGDGMAEWRALRARQITLIETFTRERFSSTILGQAKAAAEKSPHPFWAARIAVAQRSKVDRDVG